MNTTVDTKQNNNQINVETLIIEMAQLQKRNNDLKERVRKL